MSGPSRQAERLHAVTCAVPAAYFADNKDCTCGLADQVNAACDPKPASAEATVGCCSDGAEINAGLRQRISELEAALQETRKDEVIARLKAGYEVAAWGRVCYVTGQGLLMGIPPKIERQIRPVFTVEIKAKLARKR